MVLSLFRAKNNALPESVFWKWFLEHEDQLFAWESDREAVFDRLGTAMARVHPDLTFEFGPVKEGAREFVISAAGTKAAFPAVEALYAQAPTLKRWKWVKFRPRRAELHDIEFGGRQVQAEEVRFLLARHDPKAGIVLFFDKYNESEETTFGQIGYLFLDEALGELAVETQVGFIEFQSRDSKYFEHASPLSELQSQFDEFWAGKAH